MQILNNIKQYKFNLYLSKIIFLFIFLYNIMQDDTNEKLASDIIKYSKQYSHYIKVFYLLKINFRLLHGIFHLIVI